MNFLKQLFSDQQSFYTISGEYNFLVDVTVNGIEPYSSSSLQITCYSNSSKKIVIGTKMTYFYLINKQRKVIDNKGYNYFHLSIEQAGLPLEIEVEPIEDFYKGKAIIKIKTIIVNPHLRERLFIHCPINQELKETVRFGRISLINEKSLSTIQEFVLELNQDQINLKNYYEDIQSEIKLGEKNVSIKNIYYKEKEIRLMTNVKNCLNLKIILDKLQIKDDYMNVIVDFETRNDKEFFIGLFNLIINQSNIDFSHRLYQGKVEDNYYELVNQNQQLRWENYQLLKQINHKPERLKIFSPIKDFKKMKSLNVSVNKEDESGHESKSQQNFIPELMVESDLLKVDQYGNYNRNIEQKNSIQLQDKQSDLQNQLQKYQLENKTLKKELKKYMNMEEQFLELQKEILEMKKQKLV